MVSKPLPSVSKVAVPVAGAVQANQTDLSPVKPACVEGSPASRVAQVLSPWALPEAPATMSALAKLSFEGRAGSKTTE